MRVWIFMVRHVPGQRSTITALMFITSAKPTWTETVLAMPVTVISTAMVIPTIILVAISYWSKTAHQPIKRFSTVRLRSVTAMTITAMT